MSRRVPIPVALMIVLAGCGTAEPESSGLAPGLCEAVPRVDAGSGAVEVELCVRQVVDYADAGQGEDYWTEVEMARPALGHRARLLRDGRLVWEGWLGDGHGGEAGCTRVSLVPGAHDLVLLPHASGGVGENEVVVFDDDRRECWDAERDVNRRRIEVADDGGAMLVTLERGSDLLNVSMVAGWILARHDGGFADQTMTVWVGGTASLCCREDGVTRARIGGTGFQSKVAIAHELGHYYDVLAADHLGFWIDCTFADPEGQCAHPSDPGDTHTTGTLEWSTCAAREGFADFFTALTWNDPTDEDCWLQLKGERVDCRGGDGTAYPVAYMESVCSGPQPGEDPYRGLGVQIDWARTMWGMVSGPDPKPALVDLLEWLREAGRWPADQAFDALDAAAWSASPGGGESLLYERWSVAADANGIDHPGG